MPASRAAGLETLRRVAFLEGVADDLLEKLAAAARWRILAPGETVLDAGDEGGEVFFVTEGKVRVVVRSGEGHEVILNDLSAGECFGELAAIDGLRRSASVTALLRARLCSVPGPSFVALVLSSPVAGLRLLRLLTARIRLKDQRTIEAAVLPARERLLAELLRMSTPRSRDDRRVTPPPPQHVIAARLGLRRETVSRELSRLARDGRISMARGAIILHNAEDLQADLTMLLASDGDSQPEGAHSQGPAARAKASKA
ncbi:Crp/Fnr family transcriptional regulator [Falsiroseomonas bella]|uniref:Crp/Fnr family transcriptional regulator n=1 Tax=Falsiroseomonas bella TaxID=2184016 RepID=A0A317F7M7_9PROT|nr:Crp/Fnr family transcriptional regulator [Falsiroseomonas bella]